MKIVRFSQNGHAPRLGCFVDGDRVMDLAASGAAYLGSRGVVRAEAIADAHFPQSTRGFLEGGAASQDMLVAMLDASKGGKFAAITHPAGAVRLHAPINAPRQVHLHRAQLQGPCRGDQQPRPQAATGVPQVGQHHHRSGRAHPAAPGREDPGLGGGAGGGDRTHRALRLPGQGARLRLWLHHRQRRQRSGLPVPHHAMGRGQGGRHPGAGGPIHRRPRGDPGPPRPRSQDLGQRLADAEREHPELHLRRALRDHVPDEHHDAGAGGPHRHRHPGRGGLLAQAAGHAATRRHRQAWRSPASARSRIPSRTRSEVRHGGQAALLHYVPRGAAISPWASATTATSGSPRRSAAMWYGCGRRGSSTTTCCSTRARASASITSVSARRAAPRGDP